jgi:hypothetical protein
MAITVIKPSEMGNHASFGQELGQSLGQGFQGALGGLAQGKIAELLGKQQERKMHKQREDLVKAGYSESDADAILAGYSPEQIKLMQVLSSGRGPQGQENAMQIGQPMGQPQGNDQNMLSSLLGQSQQGGGQQDAIIQNLMKMLQTPQQQIPQMQQQAQPQMQQMPQMQTPQQSIGAQQKFQPLTTAQKIAQYENPQMKLQRELAANKEEGVNRRHEEDTFNKSYTAHKKNIDEIRNRGSRSEEQIRLLKDLKSLNKSGSLLQGKKRQALKEIGNKLGMDLEQAFSNPQSELAGKVIEQLSLGAGTAYKGARPTNFLVQSYKAQLPQLIQSKEGIDAIADNLILQEKLNTAHSKEQSKLLNKYSAGKKALPFDFEDQVVAALIPKKEAYAKKFEKNVQSALKYGNKGRTDYLTKPSPSSKPIGHRLQEVDTGKYLVNTGKDWVSEEEYNALGSK